MKPNKIDQPELDLNVEPARKKKPTWNFVTNHRNLFYLLAAGMVMPPKGYLKKYYQDSLNLRPGWIPLANSFAPDHFIQMAISEKDWLKPCYITLNIEDLSGKAYAMSHNGEVQQISLPNSDIQNIDLLLLPAPLPNNWIESITFQNKKDKDLFLSEADDYSNVPLKRYKIKTNASAFKSSQTIDLGKLPPLPKDYDVSPDKSLAYGAILAMIQQYTEHSSLACQISSIGFSPNDPRAKNIEDPILKHLSSWITLDSRPEEMDTVSAKTFWGVVNLLASLRSKEEGGRPLDEILEYLTLVNSNLQSAQQERLRSLIQDVTDISGMGDSTISELFQRNTRPLSRAIIMLALRDSCSDLINFKHESLTESDIVLSAILFAVRDSWLGMPLHLRGNTQNISCGIEHRMASVAHQYIKSGIQLGSPPPRPKVLRELFPSADNLWSKKQFEAALFLARGMKWNCIKTTITLGKGDYQMQIDGKGTHITFDGEAKSIISTVEQNQFLDSLTTASIPPRLLKKVYHDLGEEMAQ